MTTDEELMTDLHEAGLKINEAILFIKLIQGDYPKHDRFGIQVNQVLTNLEGALQSLSAAHESARIRRG
jgi:hypothetical protein